MAEEGVKGAYPKKDKQVNKYCARATERRIWAISLFLPLILLSIILQFFYGFKLVRRCTALFLASILSVAGAVALTVTFYLMGSAGDLQVELTNAYYAAETEMQCADFYHKVETSVLPEMKANRQFIQEEYAFVSGLCEEIDALTSWSNEIARTYAERYEEQLASAEGVQKNDNGSYSYSFLSLEGTIPSYKDGDVSESRCVIVQTDRGKIMLPEMSKFFPSEKYTFSVPANLWNLDYYLGVTRDDLDAILDELDQTISVLETYLSTEPAYYSGGKVPETDALIFAYFDANDRYVQKGMQKYSLNHLELQAGITLEVLLFLSMLVLSIGGLVFAFSGKKLRRQVKAVAKEMDVLGGQSLRDEYESAIMKASRQRDAEAFYGEIEARHAQFETALPTLPFASVRAARAGIGEIVKQCGATDGADAAKALGKECKALWKARDHAKLMEYKTKYAEKYQEYRKTLSQKSDTAEGLACGYGGESRFDGKLLQKFGWDVLCFVVKWITLTIAKPATECWKQSWYTKHTVIDGRRLSFDGNGLQLFGKRTLNLFLTVITLGIYSFFSRFSMDKWVAKHTHVEGSDRSQKGTFDGSSIVWLFVRLGCFLVNICTLYIMKPFTYCWKHKWYTSHCIYDGMCTSFDGNGAQLIGKYIIWWLLSIVTVGIYAIWLGLNLYKWKTAHTHFA